MTPTSLATEQAKTWFTAAGLTLVVTVLWLVGDYINSNVQPLLTLLATTVKTLHALLLDIEIWLSTYYIVPAALLALGLWHKMLHARAIAHLLPELLSENPNPANIAEGERLRKQQQKLTDRSIPLLALWAVGTLIVILSKFFTDTEPDITSTVVHAAVITAIFFSCGHPTPLVIPPSVWRKHPTLRAQLHDTIHRHATRHSFDDDGYGWAIHYLLTHPEKREELTGNPAYKG